MEFLVIAYYASLLLSIFNYLTRSAYLRVFKLYSALDVAGDKLAIINVLQFPTNESFNTKVNLDPLKGKCLFSISNALIHSFNAKRLLLISAPSSLVYLSLSYVSAPRSLPAKSMKVSFPIDDVSFVISYKSFDFDLI